MTDWVAARFDDALGWTHTWVDRKNDNRWSCHGLRDAFLHYRWNGEAWAGTKTALDAFRCELREAVKTEDVGRVVTVCENILQWGGVAAHNVRYLHRQQPVLVRELQHVRDLLSRHCTPSKHDLRREPDNPATACRMNAGFVKIYSLLCDDCVIYDGRVGAALLGVIKFPPHARGWTVVISDAQCTRLVSPARAGMDPQASSSMGGRSSFGVVARFEN